MITYKFQFQDQVQIVNIFRIQEQSQTLLNL